MEPLISVILPVYNTASYLDKCLRSIIEQTYRNIEIICIDDGSTDESGKILDEYAKGDSRIKVIHKQNGGLVNARKVGVRLATGKYTCQIDSDDWIELDMLEKLCEKVELYNADIVCSGFIRNYKSNSIMVFNSLEDGIYEGDELTNKLKKTMMYDGHFFKEGVNVHVGNKLFKTEQLKKFQENVDDEIRIGEDAALVYPYINKSTKVVIFNECFYHYVLREDSCVGTQRENDFFRLKKLYTHLLKYAGDDIEYEISRYMLYLGIMMIPQIVLKDIEYIYKLLPGTREGERIILYGAGKLGKALHSVLKKQFNITWVDKNTIFSNNLVQSPEIFKSIKQDEYDHIVLAGQYNVADDMFKLLMDMGISTDKIVRLCTNNITTDNVMKMYERDKDIRE